MPELVEEPIENPNPEYEIAVLESGFLHVKYGNYWHLRATMLSPQHLVLYLESNPTSSSNKVTKLELHREVTDFSACAISNEEPKYRLSVKQSNGE